jgi:hypothetical protein
MRLGGIRLVKQIFSGLSGLGILMSEPIDSFFSQQDSG